jgi:hypothetical protein
MTISQLSIFSAIKSVTVGVISRVQSQPLPARNIRAARTELQMRAARAKRIKAMARRVDMAIRVDAALESVV